MYWLEDGGSSLSNHYQSMLQRKVFHYQSDQIMLKVLRILEESGIDLIQFKLPSSAKTLLMHCAEHKLFESMEYLVDKEVAVDAVDSSGNSALFYSVQHYYSNSELADDYRKNAIDFLLQLGAGIDKKNTQGNTALHHAISISKSENALALINKGAAIDEMNNIGQTPLMLAITLGSYNVFEK
jgi:ankyrin repeat protein